MGNISTAAWLICAIGVVLDVIDDAESISDIFKIQISSLNQKWSDFNRQWEDFSFQYPKVLC